MSDLMNLSHEATDTSVETPVETQAAPQTQPETPAPATEKPAPKEFKPKNDEFARQFSALSRRERELRQREQRIKEMEEKLKPAAPAQDWKVRMRTEPLKVLEEAGVSFDYLARVAADGGATPDEAKLFGVIQEQRSAIEELRAELAAIRQEKELSKEEQQIQQFVNGLTDFVHSDGEKYKAIIAQDAVQLVFDVIEQDFNGKVEQGQPNPTVMSYAEAADLVESYLREQARKQAEALGFYTPPAAPQGQGASEVKTPGSTARPTLSNELSAQTPTKKDPSSLSEEEAFARAVELLRFQE